MGRPKKGTPRVIPTCHPDRRHQALGLCSNCYRIEYTKRRRLREPNYERYRGWDYHLKRRYGLTVEDYKRILAAQGGHCALCSMRPSETKKRFCVDHCHQTGMIRGILCKFCNSKLGWFENRAAAVAKYLDNHHDFVV